MDNNDNVMTIYDWICGNLDKEIDAEDIPNVAWNYPVDDESLKKLRA